MGTGTRFANGVIDGVAHVEGGSAVLVNGSTTITTGLDSVTSAVASNAQTDVNAPKVSISGATITITVDGGGSNRVRYIAVGPRSTQY
jgi:hypothetical protein